MPAVVVVGLPNTIADPTLSTNNKEYQEKKSLLT
jgi:hypothetical protein